MIAIAAANPAGPGPRTPQRLAGEPTIEWTLDSGIVGEPSPTKAT